MSTPSCFYSSYIFLKQILGIVSFTHKRFRALKNIYISLYMSQYHFHTLKNRQFLDRIIVYRCQNFLQFFLNQLVDKRCKSLLIYYRGSQTRIHQNHLEALKHRLLGPTAEFLIRLQCSLRTCTSNKFQGDADVGWFAVHSHFSSPPSLFHFPPCYLFVEETALFPL